MYNWSTNTRQLKKNKRAFTIWKIEQLINFGLNREKINERDLKRYWKQLDIDPKKKAYLKFLLWK